MSSDNVSPQSDIDLCISHKKIQKKDLRDDDSGFEDCENFDNEQVDKLLEDEDEWETWGGS